VKTVTGQDIEYNDVWNNAGGNYVDCNESDTDISTDPLFADPANGDFHLKSEAGRCSESGWVADSETSPCIDTGDPSYDFSNEPKPNGGRINIGAYGNTEEASMSPEKGTVKGRVTTISGIPIEGARVFLATTDANGCYTMDFWEGTHTITASKEGYADVSKEVTIVKDQTTFVNFQLPLEGVTYIPYSNSTVFSVSATDPDNDTLSYTWKLDGKMVGVADTWTYTPQIGDEETTHTVEVIVEDSKGLSDTYTWQVMVFKETESTYPPNIPSNP